jgi:hypothetical protein
MRRLLTLVVVLCCFISLKAQQPQRIPFIKSQNPTVGSILSNGPLVVDTVANIQTLVSLLFGPGIQVSNLTYSGDSMALGLFSDTTGTFGIDSGIVMTTGFFTDIPGPNVSASTTGVTYAPGDSSLASLVSWPTYDACVIEFDMTPLTDTLLASEFIFGSEEYPEWVGSNFNDVFAFFISGPGITGTQNIALVPGTSVPVCVNNVNPTLNSQYYNN